MSLNENLNLNPQVPGCTCYLCFNKNSILGKKRVPWTVVCRYILLSLNDISVKQYYSAHDDIYPFVIEHWSILGSLQQFSDNSSWRKALLDAMNHSDQFESGTIKKRIGLWRLRTSPPLSPQKKSGKTKPKKNTKSISIKHRSKDIDQKQTNSLRFNTTITPTLHYQNDRFVLPKELLQQICGNYASIHNYLHDAGVLLSKLPLSYIRYYNTTQKLLGTVSRLQFELFEQEMFPSSYITIRLL
ncbi:Fork-head domain-containing protein [Entamoeba marina]